MRILIFASTSALAFGLGVQPASAQTTAGAPMLGQQAAAPSWSSEIVVTGVRKSDAVPNTQSATRTDTPLIQIPQSVQVITSTLMQDQDVRTLSDALVNVSGVTATKSEEVLFTPPIVRGFPAEVYVDGLPIFGGNQQAFDPASLVGVDRIEVLKGPTSTLYGGGLGTPLGGLINIVSARPADTFGGFIAIRGGSFSTWNPYGEVNLPLASGVAAHIAAEYQSNGSWIDQVKGERWSVKPSLSIQLGQNTDLMLQGQINHTSQLEYSGLPAAQALAGQLERNAFPGAPIGQPQTVVDNHLATAELHHAFNENLKLTVTGRYYDSTVHENGSFVLPSVAAPDPATPTLYPILPMDMLVTTKEGALDANLLAKGDVLGGHHEVLVGASYDYTNFFSGMGFSGMPVGSIDLAHPIYNLAFGALTPANLTQTDHYETVAGYLQDQATYGRLHLTGSLRFTQLNFREAEEGTDKSYSHLSPRVGATFDLIPGVALYAGYATAFRAPFGFVGLATPKPETSTNYEGGLKVALTNLGLSGTIAAFDQTHENIATPIPNNLFYSQQTGQQRARGMEADFIWEPIPAFSLLANYAYTEAEVTKDNSIPVGNVLPRVPKNSGRIAARYRVLNGDAKGLSFGVGVTAFSARQDTLPNSVWVPGYTMVDAQAAYDFGRFTIAVSAVNLNGSKAYDTYEYFGFPVVIPVQPRSAYVTLKARF
jgi:iron complex outermembrane receptor protein